MLIDGHKILSAFHLGRARLAEQIRYLIELGLVRWYLGLLSGLNLFNWFLAYYVNRHVCQSLVVLHYNVNLGVNLVGQARQLYLIPFLGLVFLAINLLLLLNLQRRSRFLIHLLLGFSSLISLFLIASTISIFLINFR